jgi:hypothetical protein
MDDRLRRHETVSNILVLKLTRFCGHPTVGIFGVHDGKEADTVCAGVPPADD